MHRELQKIVIELNNKVVIVRKRQKMKRMKKATAVFLAFLLAFGSGNIEMLRVNAEELETKDTLEVQDTLEAQEVQDSETVQETETEDNAENNIVDENQQIQEEPKIAAQDNVESSVVSGTDKAENKETEELKENSWRYSNGELIHNDQGISTYSSRDASTAWKKVNGRYINDKGNVIPGAEKKGVDVSKWQEQIDWKKAKADGVEFAIIRCGSGKNNDDKWWKYNVSECERLGIPYGVYLYSYATNENDAKLEAEHTLRLLNGHHPSLPVYYDLEDVVVENAGKAMIGQMAKTYCNIVSAAGYRVGIYASLSWWRGYLNTPTFQNNSWSKWIAQWNSTCDYSGSYDMWQCTGKGSVKGINGQVDLNFWMVKTDDKAAVKVDDTKIINYTSHMQTFGWQDTVGNGYQTGVTGYSKRMEAFKINVGDGYSDLGIKYSAHVQTYGWQNYVSNGELAGTTGEGKRVEAVKIELTGSKASDYDIYYRVHAQSYGWLDWAKNGEPAGTQGYSKRLEALQIVVLPKGSEAPGVTSKAFVKIPMQLQYSSYVYGIGWKTALDGAECGTKGQSRMLEGLSVKIDNPDYEGDIVYDTYMQTKGWTGEKKNGESAGSPGNVKRLEAIRIHLTGELEKKYNIYYRTYCQNYGWLDWAKDGEIAGTLGYSKRIESIQIKLVSKDAAAPGATKATFKQSQIQYRTHVQTYGWQDYQFEGETSGTSGLAKRLEAIQIQLSDTSMNQYLEYRTHVQTYGWQDWVNGGKISGTSGQAKRLEAIQIKLKSQMADKYDIYYRVHAQTYGWLDWAKNGESAGTEGLAKRLEAIQIVLVEKGGAAPGKIDNPFVKK